MAGGNKKESTVTVVESKEWYLSAYAPQGVPNTNHLKLRNVSLTIDAIPDGHVAVQILLLSVDPYLRARMTGSEDGLYTSQFKLNEAIRAFGIGRVIESTDSKHAKGDIIVYPFFPVAEYCVIPSDPTLRKINPAEGIELPDYLSCLGIPGFAAWVGIKLIGEPKEGSNVFISAAAGGVGMFAGQLAKLKGCRVVGSTGSDEKVKLLKDEFGYDEAFNYKRETDFDSAISKYIPNGIDVYLDNVGGKMLEAVLNHVNYRARIALCGMISDYNEVWTEREGVRNLLNMVGKEVRMEGFMLGSYLGHFEGFAKEMEEYLNKGMIKSKQHMYNGIESFLESLASLFSSSNNGKVIVQVQSWTGA
ncbi:hypothetical protein K2173_018888 [Erythroxylum novogranatense]|uniref:Enoyl reductase (ER) domain-containing protein n=1 Tax=Erythroxylum novogranatense TaxID=1862640 RepID=A0AAV8SAY9_9ROSI|nr:hypothetical protein K2173_018888 [Erythroxylum novogranatense]